MKYDYYGAPWEAETDELGGVNRVNDNTPWPEGTYAGRHYFDKEQFENLIRKYLEE